MIPRDPTSFRPALRRLLFAVLVAWAGGRAGAQDWLQTAPAPDWTRHFRLGAVVGLDLQAKFKMDGTFNVSGGNQAGPIGVPRAEHIYDDGYVRVDDTGNAGGDTGYWGYDSPAQYDPVNRTLTFHSSSSFTLSDRTSVDSTAQVGLELVYGGNLMKSGDALLGWEFGFVWMPIFLQDNRALATTFSRLTHVFDTGDIVLPEAPYHGGPSGAGEPTIRDLASAGTSDSSPGTITGSRALEVTLYNFRLGPTLHWELTRHFAFAISGGAAVGLADCEYKFKERIQITGGGQTSNRGSFSQTDVVYGAYGGVTFLYHTIEKADVFVSAQYLMLDKVGVSAAGRTATLDLGGNLYLSAGVNWPF
jgi:hypothetical protein